MTIALKSDNLKLNCNLFFAIHQDIDLNFSLDSIILIVLIVLCEKNEWKTTYEPSANRRNWAHR